MRKCGWERNREVNLSYVGVGGLDRKWVGGETNPDNALGGKVGWIQTQMGRIRFNLS